MCKTHFEGVENTPWCYFRPFTVQNSQTCNFGFVKELEHMFFVFWCARVHLSLHITSVTPPKHDINTTASPHKETASLLCFRIMGLVTHCLGHGLSYEQQIISYRILYSIGNSNSGWENFWPIGVYERF